MADKETVRERVQRLEQHGQHGRPGQHPDRPVQARFRLRRPRREGGNLLGSNSCRLLTTLSIAKDSCFPSPLLRGQTVLGSTRRAETLRHRGNTKTTGKVRLTPSAQARRLRELISPRGSGRWAWRNSAADSPAPPSAHGRRGWQGSDWRRQTSHCKRRSHGTRVRGQTAS